VTARASDSMFYPVSEMTYTVSSGTLNSSIPYHSMFYPLTMCVLQIVFIIIMTIKHHLVSKVSK